MKIHTDIENQITRKEEYKTKCLDTSEKHGLCLLGCWLLFLIIMSILISEYGKK